jgi:hypothetical protein
MSKQRNTTPRRQHRPNRRYRRLLPTVVATAALATGAGVAPPALAHAADHHTTTPQTSGGAKAPSMPARPPRAGPR